jgi:serine/threonine protein kinase
MNSLVGVFIEEEKEVHLNEKAVLYPFKLIFPPNKSRVYYLISKEERDAWVRVIKKAIGYSNIEDYYKIDKDLGKGKFGHVKLAIHKKTGKYVAIKIIRKKDLKLNELEL